MDYVAIDFETANGNLTSACSIGIVAVENDKVVFMKEYLINPLEEFSDFNISIHHIREEDVLDALTFPELYLKIKHLFEGNIVVAHCSDFDVAVLKALIEKYQLDPPNIKIACTLKIARKIWKGELPNLKLNTLSNFLEVEHNHHDSLSDAFVCYKIIERAKRVNSVASLEELYDALGLRFGIYNKNEYQKSTSIYKRKSKKVNIVNNNVLYEKVVCYAGKPKHMTKNEFIKKVESNGGYVTNSINKSTNYFVIFENCPKAKFLELRRAKEKGYIVQSLDEEQILRILK